MIIETNHYQIFTGPNADPQNRGLKATVVLHRAGGARIQLSAIELQQFAALAAAAADDQNREAAIASWRPPAQ